MCQVRCTGLKQAPPTFQSNISQHVRSLIHVEYHEASP